MLEDRLDFFRELLDEEAINTYMRLSRIEDEAILSIEILNIEASLKKTIKIKNMENFNEQIILLNNYLMYKVNCLVKGLNENCHLGETLKLAKQACKEEKQCLILLKKALDYSTKNQIDLNHNNNVSTILLCMFALNQLSKKRDEYCKEQYVKTESEFKGISVWFPKEKEYDLSKNISDIEKVKQYSLNSLRR